jgi:hypothetical protein
VSERTTTAKDTFRLAVNCPSALSGACSRITAAFKDHKYLVVSVRPGRDRSAEQNKLWQGMYKRVSQTIEQGSPVEVWAYCKLMLGVPILRRDDERFSAGWERYFADRTYGEQLFLMGANPLFGPDGFPVTRLFGTKQGREYTDAIADHYAAKGVFFGDLLGAAA